eukprot:TRINITY_DN4152_c0_g1_i1.p1 TRINITY_DN4152_c0_g1~~TRINITY_DN4152_c0_g1_i1.p1  ORF type:complete len:1313 (-),score=347.23 TRINITY_DN4152_c0_g1_i1:70-3933(-)
MEGGDQPRLRDYSLFSADNLWKPLDHEKGPFNRNPEGGRERWNQTSLSSSSDAWGSQRRPDTSGGYHQNYEAKYEQQQNPQFQRNSHNYRIHSSDPLSTYYTPNVQRKNNPNARPMDRRREENSSEFDYNTESLNLAMRRDRFRSEQDSFPLRDENELSDRNSNLRISGERQEHMQNQAWQTNYAQALISPSLHRNALHQQQQQHQQKYYAALNHQNSGSSYYDPSLKSSQSAESFAFSPFEQSPYPSPGMGRHSASSTRASASSTPAMSPAMSPMLSHHSFQSSAPTSTASSYNSQASSFNAQASSFGSQASSFTSQASSFASQSSNFGAQSNSFREPTPSQLSPAPERPTTPSAASTSSPTHAVPFITSFDNLKTKTSNRVRRNNVTRLVVSDQQALIENKQGVIITPEVLDFGTFDPSETQYNEQPHLKTITIHNHLMFHVVLNDIILLPHRPQFKFSDHKDSVKNGFNAIVKEGKQIVIPPGSQFSFVVSFHVPPSINFYRQWIIFCFQGDTFFIGRKILSLVTCKREMRLLEPTSMPFYPHSLKTLFDSETATVLEGPIPPMVEPPAVHGGSPGQFNNKNAPNEYVVPQSYVSLAQKLEAEKSTDLGTMLPALDAHYSDPTYQNYRLRFQILLYMEEVQMMKDIKMYDLYAVPLRISKANDLVRIQVPGLAENRPPVLYGDRVRVRDSQQPHWIEFIGYVHSIRDNAVYVRFHRDFYQYFGKQIKNQHFHVRFTYDRGNIKRMHQALEAMRYSKLILFPKEIDLPNEEMRLATTRVEFKDLNPRLNNEQKSVVCNILNNTHGKVPYVCFGPPGTGKTFTLIETVVEILKRQPDTRMLIVTQSNHAADIVAEGLSHYFTPHQLLRLNLYQRKVESVKSSVLSYCLIDEYSGLFCLPLSLLQIQGFDIVVTTCSASQSMETIETGLGKNHFTHIFFDEAVQCLEPECLIPLTSFSNDSTQIAMFGDHLQLGPSVRSSIASDNGLSISLQEGLMTLPLYNSASTATSLASSSAFSRFCCTQLKKIYRSHPAIVSLNSKLFYQDQLEICTPKSEARSMCDWEELNNKDDFPILFYGIESKDMREGESISFFNPLECIQVCELIEKLLTSKRVVAATNDIGVISPYKDQVQKIRGMLRSKGLSSVRVGTVEDYQGQEEKIVFISTVRSEQRWIPFDKKHNIGLIGNPKAFNVAVTRAKALLVVVGNPFILVQDPLWRSLLKYCVRHNAYRGVSIESLIETAAEGEEDLDFDDDAIAEWVALGSGEVNEDEEELANAFMDEKEWRVSI